MKTKLLMLIFLCFTVYLFSDPTEDLWEAVFNSDIEMVNAALDAGADVNARDDYHQTTVLMSAIRDDNIQIIKLLIESGADTEMQDDMGNTALHHAITWPSNPQVVGLLLKNGADVNLKNYFGFTPLMRARIAGNEEIIKLLIGAGGNEDNNIVTEYVDVKSAGNDYMIFKTQESKEKKLIITDTTFFYSQYSNRTLENIIAKSNAEKQVWGYIYYNKNTNELIAFEFTIEDEYP